MMTGDSCKSEGNPAGDSSGAGVNRATGEFLPGSQDDTAQSAGEVPASISSESECRERVESDSSRLGRLSEIREAIDAGVYDSDALLEAAIARMLKKIADDC